MVRLRFAAPRLGLVSCAEVWQAEEKTGAGGFLRRLVLSLDPAHSLTYAEVMSCSTSFYVVRRLGRHLSRALLNWHLWVTLLLLTAAEWLVPAPPVAFALLLLVVIALAGVET